MLEPTPRAFASNQGSNEASDSFIFKRAKPRVILLDSNMNVVFAEAKACATLWRSFDVASTNTMQLPEPVAAAVASAVSEIPEQSDREQIVRIDPNLLLRVARLRGAGGSYIGVFIEQIARREDLAATAKRFNLTNREVEVLSLILRGYSAIEIADRLAIAQLTVKDYCKALLRKTNARNRAEMLAKALNWAS